ncbi:MAG: WcaF family extracellular polysaccharide biosynthesis acetyltransferase [Crocinitomicaceae bacterium]|nr:colanic acid biosynthesis acetyltransferase WcaF [Crocinitomicaceae bacterium]
MKTDLSKFNNDWYQPGNKIKRALWFCFNNWFLLNKYNPFSGLKKLILRMFGAKIGKGVVIKPRVNIKYPWKLEIGDNTWIGEGVWIDNLGQVKIGANCCISQGALLLCGNHDYKKVSFDLMVGDIELEEGVWLGAKSIVTGKVKCYSHAILMSGSVASADLESYTIYRGNPAEKIRERKMDNE